MDRLLKPAEVCEYLNICDKTWVNFKAKRIIPYFQEGRIVRVKKSDLDAYVESKTKTETNG